MVASLAALVSALFEAVVMVMAGLLLLGLPLALFEGLFGQGRPRGRGGIYPDDRSAQELYERRLRDSRRR